MATLFLLIIYLTFISLGLPDTILGSAWTVVYPDLGVKLSAAGLISFVISGCTILSSILSTNIIKKFGTGPVTFVSVAATALALLGFSFAPGYIWFVLLAVPLGLGAGAVDAGLNNYVALHYKAHHMSWLHSFWGIGAFCGPLIMAHFIAQSHNWRGGYFTISMIQFFVAAVLLVSLPLWKKNKGMNNEKNKKTDGLASKQKFSVFKIPGVRYSLISFIFYSGVEASVGLWGSSFLVNMRNLQPSAAAGWAAIFFGAITAGRILTGFLNMRFTNKFLIRSGQIIILIGGLLILIPFSPYFALAGFICTGFGCAPIFPGMLHETPERFGKENSQKVMGYQVGFSYIGTSVLPPLLGIIAANTSFIVFPVFLACSAAVMFLASEKINLMMKKRQPR